MTKVWLLVAALSAFLSVGLGALGAHSLRYALDEYGRTVYEKAVTYQMFHTIGLFIVGLLQTACRPRSFSVAGWSFLLGILLFSGSLYALALTGAKGWGVVTPLGGIFFLLGWAFLGLRVITAKF